MEDKKEYKLEERLIYVNRCAKVLKGGRKFSFSALVAVGDMAGHVGLGIGKANEASIAIQKAIEAGKKMMFEVPIYNDTIPHPITCSFGAAKVLLKPAKKGKGIIAGGAIRPILELAGIKNIVAKDLASTTQINAAKATEKALKNLKPIEELKILRGYQGKEENE